MNKKWILLLGTTFSLLLVLLNNYSLLVYKPQIEPENIVSTTKTKFTDIIDKKKIKLDKKDTIITHTKADVISVEEILPATTSFGNWRQPSKFFQPFFELNNKALNTKDERDHYKLLIDSGELLAVTEKVLLAKVTEKKIDYVKERARLDALYYLSSIISGKYDSSQFDIAIELATEVLNNPTVRDEQGEELKKSLLGDKIEVGLDLAIFQPKIWDEYKNSDSGDEKHQKLIAYIDSQATFQQKIMLDQTERIAKRLKQRQSDISITEH